MRFRYRLICYGFALLAAFLISFNFLHTPVASQPDKEFGSAKPNVSKALKQSVGETAALPVAPVYLPPPPARTPVSRNLMETVRTLPVAPRRRVPLRAVPVSEEPSPPPKFTPLRPTAAEPKPGIATPIKPLAPVPEDRQIARETAAPETVESRRPEDAAVLRQSVAVAVEPDKATVAKGRVLLRILEHGAGPEIEIGWPETVSRRRRLHDYFRACFGMRISMMDGRGALYFAEGARGKPGRINLDRYSGFVRRPAGRIVHGERREALRIAAYHGGLRRAASVRLFPRRVDAVLLGGLRRLIGEAYGSARSIRASYRFASGRVSIGNIRVDGRPVRGRIELTGAARPGCARRQG